jgi:hypothetical protein
MPHAFRHFSPRPARPAWRLSAILGITTLIACAGCSGPGDGYQSVDLTASKQAAEAKGLSRGNDPEKAARTKRESAVPGKPVGKRATR